MRNRAYNVAGICKMFCSIGLLFLALACNQEQAREQQNVPADTLIQARQDTPIASKPPETGSEAIKTTAPDTMSQLEKRIRDAGLVSIRSINRDIRVNLRYAGTNNFVGSDIYGDLDSAYFQPEVARKLAKAQEYLDSVKPGYSILVWDAVRPVSAQQKLWDSIKKPDSLKHLYVAHPSRGSIHNYGCAADVTLVNEQGELLDMGTDFDHFSIKAYPREEARCLREQILQPQQVVNREVLREAMKHAGFTPITTEWWHFNACSRKYARKHYKQVE